MRPGRHLRRTDDVPRSAADHRAAAVLGRGTDTPLCGHGRKGRGTTAILDELCKEETAKKALIGQLEDLARLTQVASLDAKRIEWTLMARVADAKGLIGTHIPQTRQILRKLIERRIVCTPFNDARGRGYAVAATGSYAGLFRVAAAVNDGGGEGGI